MDDYIHAIEYEEARLTLEELYPEVVWSVLWSHNRKEIQFTVTNGVRSYTYQETSDKFRTIAENYQDNGWNLWENLADAMVLKIDPGLVSERMREREDENES